jgi:hypothetical protein
MFFSTLPQPPSSKLAHVCFTARLFDDSKTVKFQPGYGLPRRLRLFFYKIQTDEVAHEKRGVATMRPSHGRRTSEHSQAFWMGKTCDSGYRPACHRTAERMTKMIEKIHVPLGTELSIR